jgi:hypothetical protein
LSASTQDIFKQKLRKEIGSAQFMILPGEKSGKQYIDETDFVGREGIGYAVPLISAYGYSKFEDENVPVAFTGMSAKDYDTVYGLEYPVGMSDILS